MRHSLRLWCSALATAVVLVVAVGTASANRLSISNKTIRLVWDEASLAGSQLFRVSPAAGSGIAVECPVTMEGSFHSNTIAKVARSLIGYISRVIVNKAEPPCQYTNASELTFLTLPWHIQYDSFTNALPRIGAVRIRVIGLAYRLVILGANCLYRSTEAAPAYAYMDLNEASTITRLELDALAEIPLSEGIFQCPARTILEQVAQMTLLNALAALSIRLI